MNGELSTSPVPGLPPSGQMSDQGSEAMAGGGREGAERMLSALACLVRRTFDENSDYREASGTTARLLRALEYCRRRYPPEKLARFAELGMEPVYVPIVDQKRRDAIAFLSELFDQPGEKSWTISPTPWPEVPMDVREKAYREALEYIVGKVEEGGGLPMQDVAYYFAQNMVEVVSGREMDLARKRCAKMERLVSDQMEEGRFKETFRDFVNDVCTFGTGIVRGPVPAVVRGKKYVRGRSGTWKVECADRLSVRFDAVSPLDVFPSKGMRGVDDGPVCIRVRYSPEELRRLATRMAGNESWLSDAVDAVLALNPQGGVGEEVSGDYERRALADDGSRAADETVLLTGIEYFGEVRGSMLAEFGVKRTSAGGGIDPAAYYAAHVITVKDVVVYCRLTEPELGPPLSRGVFYRQADGWFGDSLADILASSQDTANAAMRDLCVNMGMSSGPQVVISDVDRLVNRDFRMAPWRTWLCRRGEYGDQSPPVKFMQPDSNAQALMQVVTAMDARADRDSGVPSAAFWQGVSGGTARTQQGIALLMEQTTRPMKSVVTSIDLDVVRRVVRMTADWNLLYSDDPEVKGDLTVQASGLMGLVLREQETQRIMAFLQATLNQFDMSIIGKRGRAAMLRETVRGMGMNPDLVVPSDSMLALLEKAERERAERESQAAQQAQQASSEAQLGNAEVQRQNADSNRMRTEAGIRQADEKLEMERENAAAEQGRDDRELDIRERGQELQAEEAAEGSGEEPPAMPDLGTVRI